MRLIIAVAADLYTFAFEALFGRREKAPAPVASDVIYLREPLRAVAAVAPREVAVHAPAVREPLPTFPTVPAHEASARKNTVMYSASVDVPLRKLPRMSDDAVIATLSYGTMVMVLDTEDGWSRVISGEQEGWVLTDDLADRAAYVYPQFSIGERNVADDPNTLRLRAMIRDAFGAGAAELPLQSEEYVLYKLHRRGVRLEFPDMPLREQKRWSLLIRELPNVAVSPDPKAGAVMQVHFKEDASIEHFAYVEAVFPDGSLQISEANWPEEGIYNERVLVKEEWHELNPVFLVIA